MKIRKFIPNSTHNIFYFLKVLGLSIINISETKSTISTIVSINEALANIKNKIVFFDRFAMHFSFSEPIYNQLLSKDIKAIFVVCDKQHYLFKNNNQKNCFYIDPRYELFLRFIRTSTIATPASHLPVYAKNKSTILAHYFHSPVSMHFVYGDRAFDAYDVFFAVGPYHIEEFNLLKKSRQWKNKHCYEAGYPKIDSISEKSFGHVSTNLEKQIRKIAFAPSWLGTSILRSHGHTIIENLLLSNFEVILRPHKHSFDYDMDIIRKLKTSFKKMPFIIDQSIGFDEIYDCDILISDWSGIAFEFAFGTCKPVVSVNVEGARKIQSDKNTKIGIDAFEETARFDIGLVTSPESVNECIESIYKEGLDEWSTKIIKNREKYLYNFKNSSEIIANHIIDNTLS